MDETNQPVLLTEVTDRIGIITMNRPSRRAFTLATAQQMLRTPASIWALTKDNLNQAEDDLNRRRHLFANEATNMVRSSEAIAERLLAKANSAKMDRAKTD